MGARYSGISKEVAKGKGIVARYPNWQLLATTRFDTLPGYE
jgi:hypothetical protein